MMNVFISTLLGEIDRLRSLYNFKDDESVISLDVDAITRTPKIIIRTVDREGTEITFRSIISKSDCKDMD